MPSQTHNDRRTRRRIPITRRTWFFPMLLLSASWISRGVAVGSLVVVSACESGPTLEDCDMDYEECRDGCLSAYAEPSCMDRCRDTHRVCTDDAYAALDRAEANAEAAADFAIACGAVLACTAEAVDDSSDPDEGDDGWDEPAPSDDDWGEDWGERQGGDASDDLAPLDLPHG